MSVAGGLPRAVERGVAHRCEAMQVFAKNANQWRGRTLPAAEIAEFRARVETAGIHPVVSHASYLINLASPNAVLRQRSIDAMADEIERAEALGLLGVVLHPGCDTAGRREEAIRLVAQALAGLLRQRRRGRTMILLEHTAGQGGSLGASFEEIAAILALVDGHERVGVCLDTCHLVASGYDIASARGYAATFEQFDRLIGTGRLRVFHLNDSRKPLGSRVDRHTHIGRGFVGLEAFRRLLNDPRFAGLPMLLETPKQAGRGRTSDGVDRFDRRNLTLLRSLLTGRAWHAGAPGPRG